jgi:hypothetical protein
VDTRSKIVSVSEAPRNATVAVGHFDVPGVEHARVLATLRARSNPVIAIVLPAGEGEPEILNQPDRARMAAALRMVDYVLIAAPSGYPGGLDDLLTTLTPCEIVRLDNCEAGIFARRLRRLEEHA